MCVISWQPKCLAVQGIKQPRIEIMQGYVKAMLTERWAVFMFYVVLFICESKLNSNRLESD